MEYKLRLLEENELEDVIDEVKKYLPYSLTIYGHLCAGFTHQTIVREHTKIYIPEQKDSPLLIVITGSQGKGEFPLLNVFWNVGSIQRSIIAEYLSSLQEINWKQPFAFAVGQAGVLDALEDILRDEKLSGHYLKRYKVDVLDCRWMIDDVSVIPDIPLPENFELGEIHPDDANIVVKFWNTNVVELASNMKALLTHLPSSAVFYRPIGSSTRKMVSWVVTKQDGELGMTHTLAEFRNKKFATIATSDILRKHKKLGLLSYVFMRPNNLISLAIHKNIGMTATIGFNYELYQNPKNKVRNLTE